MNSCWENSHIVAAFMCHDTTNCNTLRKGYRCHRDKKKLYYTSKLVQCKCFFTKTWNMHKQLSSHLAKWQRSNNHFATTINGLWESKQTKDDRVRNKLQKAWRHRANNTLNIWMFILQGHLFSPLVVEITFSTVSKFQHAFWHQNLLGSWLIWFKSSGFGTFWNNYPSLNVQMSPLILPSNTLMAIQYLNFQNLVKLKIKFS